MALIGPGDWSAAELVALVKGKRVSLRDPTMNEIPVPGWLAEHMAGPVEQESERYIDSTYPDDRDTLINLYLDAAQRPGEALAAELRIKHEGAWRHAYVQALNLQGDPRVAGMLFTSELTDGPPILPAAGTEELTRPTAWLTWTLDEAGRVQSVAGDPEGLIGYTADELIGTLPSTISHPDGRAWAVRLWIDMHEKLDTPHSSRRQIQRKDGSWVWVEASYICRSTCPQGEAPVLGVLMDITERRQAETALHDERAESRRLAEDFRVLADEIDSAVFRCDSEGAVSFSNARWTELVARSRGRFRKITDLFRGQERQELLALLQRLTHDDTATGRTTFVGGDGNRTWQLDLRRSASAHDGRGSIIGTLNNVTDYVKLQRSAMRDPLTGLANRSVVEKQLKDDLRQGNYSTVAFIDLDGFKQVNDNFGHEAGDAALVELSGRLEAVVRPSDVVARWGGDEFVILFRGADPASVSELEKRLRTVAERPIDTGSCRWKPSFSIGCVVAQPGDSAEEIIARADQAMYDEKHIRRRGSAKPVRR